MNISVKSSFWLTCGGSNLRKEEFKIVSDYEEDSPWVLSSFLTKQARGAGIAMPRDEGDGNLRRMCRTVDFVYPCDVCDEDSYEQQTSPFQGTNIARIVEEKLGLRIARSLESRGVNEMGAHDRGSLLRVYIIQKLIDDESIPWFRFASDDSNVGATANVSLGMWMNEEDNEYLEDDKNMRSHIRVVKFGDILVPADGAPSKIEVQVKTATYRVKRTTFTPATESSDDAFLSVVTNIADGSVYSVVSNPEAVPYSIEQQREECFLTTLEARNRQRGYLGYLRDDCSSLSSYWKLRAGIDIVNTATNTVQMVRVANLDCPHYCEFDVRHHPHFPGTEMMLPCLALMSPPVAIPFRSRIDRDATIRLFTHALGKSCGEIMSVEMVPVPAGGHSSASAQPKSRPLGALVLSSALSLSSFSSSSSPSPPSSSSRKRKKGQRSATRTTTTPTPDAGADGEMKKCASQDSLDSLDSS